MDYRPSRIPVFDVFDGHQHGHVPVYDAGLHRFVDGGLPGASGGVDIYVSGLTAGDVGTHAAANLTVLQAALDAAEAAGGGRVTLPPGIYQFSGTANIGSRVVYAGLGWGSIHKLANGVSTTAAPKAVLAAKNGSNYVGVEDLYIDGNKANQVDANYASVGIDFTTRSSTEGSGAPVYDGGLWCNRVMVYNCRGEGFDVRGSASTMRVAGCYAYHNDGVGFWFRTDCEASDCVAGNNGGYGFFAQNGTSIRWTSLKAFGNCQRYSGANFLVSYCSAVTMSDLQGEDSGEAAFWWTSCGHVTATNLVAYRCAGHLSDSNKSAFWIEDDGADNLCNHFTLTGTAKCDGGASAFNYALTTRNFGPQCNIALTTEGYATSRWQHLSGSVDAVVALDDLPGYKEALTYAVSDESTDLTTGTAKLTVRIPYAFTVTSVRASVNTASGSGVVTVDVNEAGTSILSTKLTIDASEKTSVTAVTSAVISDTSLADDAELTFDIDTAGSGAKGLKVTLIGVRV